MSKSTVFSAAFLVIAAVFIFWRYQAVELSAVKEAKAIVAYAGQEVEFVAKVGKAPEDRVSRMYVVIEPEFAEEGRILLVSREELNVHYRDIIKVRGTLERPGVFEGFNYEEFLAKDGIYALMRDPTVEIEQREAYSHWGEQAMAAVFALKGTFRKVLEQYLSSRYSSIMVEMLLGDRDVMSDELAGDLNRTGLRHIIAMSGAHIAILTMYLMPFLIWVGLWRQQALLVTMVLVLFYVVLTRLQPSAVRAGIMGGMFLLGQYLGRSSAALRALVTAAVLMLLLNPLLLTRDVGFQLSFLAVLGMIVLLPVILPFLPKQMPGRQLLSMTLAAQVLTLPILIWNFGQISLVSVITNILIVPVVPLLMGLGFLLMIGGLIQPLGFLLAFPVGVLVHYILWLGRFFVDLPFAAVKTENSSVLWLLSFYTVVIFLYWKFRRRHDSFIQW